MATYQQGQPIEISDFFSADGVAADPTSVVWSLLGPDGVLTLYTWPGAPEVTHDATGSFVLSLDPPAYPGEYGYDVDATGAVVASRSGSFTVLPNRANQEKLEWAVSGPCTAWASSQDVWGICDRPMTTIGEGSMEEECPVDLSQVSFEASQVLYELSGRKFAGMCEKTVRPCRTGGTICDFQVLSRGHVVADPYSWSGSYWWGESGRLCGCAPLSQVLLSGYPVRSIEEVKIDGDVVDPETYRLDERRFLVRVRDPDEPDVRLLWPSCQHLDLDDTQDGTFSVTYQYGQDPPLTGVHAAAQLACQLYKATSGGECELPEGVTRVTRQGVTIEMLAFAAWGRQQGIWRTGLQLVDTFLNAENPRGLQRRPAFWGPRVDYQYARPVGGG